MTPSGTLVPSGTNVPATAPVPGGTLVLCVDRDDDIGYKAGVVSPVVGREACLGAATALALKDPEDSDVNAIFMGLRVYDSLIERGETAHVAILAGDHMHMLEGDRKIAASLEDVIRTTGATSCILISDGAEDEFVMPIIQSRVPVSSVQRVIVSQMPNLESSYYTIKKLLDDPKVARVFLVPLGLAMLLFATAYLMGYPEGAAIIVVGVIGVYLLFKGFGVDEAFDEGMNTIRTSFTRGRISFVTYIVALLLLVMGLYFGFSSLLQYYSEAFTTGLFLYLVAFLYGGVGWITAAALIVVVGKAIDTYMTEPRNFPRAVVLPFFVGAIGVIAYGASIYTLSLAGLAYFPYTMEQGGMAIILSIVGGLFCAFFGVYLRSVLERRSLANGAADA
jgi:putative membrane protein